MLEGETDEQDGKVLALREVIGLVGRQTIAKIEYNSRDKGFVQTNVEQDILGIEVKEGLSEEAMYDLRNLNQVQKSGWGPF